MVTAKTSLGFAGAAGLLGCLLGVGITGATWQALVFGVALAGLVGVATQAGQMAQVFGEKNELVGADEGMPAGQVPGESITTSAGALAGGAGVVTAACALADTQKSTWGWLGSGGMDDDLDGDLDAMLKRMQDDAVDACLAESPFIGD